MYYAASINSKEWKLRTLIPILRKENIAVPAMVCIVYKQLLNNIVLSDTILQSAYDTCFTLAANKHLPNIAKSLTRLACIRTELLLLLENSTKTKEELTIIYNVLDIIPDKSAFNDCEIKLNACLHTFLPNELSYARVLMFSKTFYVKPNIMSKQTFMILKLGRTAPTALDKNKILALIENQLQLWYKLSGLKYSKQLLSTSLEKEMLTVCHWVPKTIDEAISLYEHSKKLLVKLIDPSAADNIGNLIVA